jgi:hypothetical protein
MHAVFHLIVTKLTPFNALTVVARPLTQQLGGRQPYYYYPSQYPEINLLPSTGEHYLVIRKYRWVFLCCISTTVLCTIYK